MTTLTRAQLMAELDLSRPVLNGWLREGLPVTDESGEQVFDTAEVRTWLIQNGKVTQRERRVVSTRAAAARHCGVHERTFAVWMNEPDFPAMKPSQHGGSDGEYDLDAIDRWRRDTGRSSGRPGGQGSDEDSPNRLLTRIRATSAALDLAERRGSVLNYDDQLGHYRRVVGSAVSVMSQLPDRLIKLLPSDLPPQVLDDIRTLAANVVKQTCRQIEELATLDEEAAA